jgi:Leucine-rich repeat (LRR) protein
MEMSASAGVSGMKQLQVFMASHNNVCSVDPFSFNSPYLAYVDLSSNCVSSIQGLQECPRLLVADLSRNLIASLQALSACSLLQVCLCVCVCVHVSVRERLACLTCLLHEDLCAGSFYVQDLIYVQDLSVSENPCAGSFRE